jgi:hypothetical protein
MISMAMAQKLKEAGLPWTPAKNDFFMIPDRGLDDNIFVITDMTIFIETLSGQPAVTFHGTAEWALDHVLIAELIWLPTETQLRELIEQRLLGEPEPALVLSSTADGYRCEIHSQEKVLTFDGFGVAELYAQVLLYLIQEQDQGTP